MKKILVSILAIFYLTSSVGATVHLHYCMDKLINWSLLKGDGDKCGKCGMEKDGGCCKDEHKLVKNSSDQKTVESAIYFLQSSAIATPHDVPDIAVSFSSSLIQNPNTHAPPLNCGIHILNCVFRI